MVEETERNDKANVSSAVYVTRATMSIEHIVNTRSRSLIDRHAYRNLARQNARRAAWTGEKRQWSQYEVEQTKHSFESCDFAIFFLFLSFSAQQLARAKLIIISLYSITLSKRMLLLLLHVHHGASASALVLSLETFITPYWTWNKCMKFAFASTLLNICHTYLSWLLVETLSPSRTRCLTDWSRAHSALFFFLNNVFSRGRLFYFACRSSLLRAASSLWRSIKTFERTLQRLDTFFPIVSAFYSRSR